LAGQINAFLKRAFKYASCAKIYTIGAIAEEADKLLFKKMMSAKLLTVVFIFVAPC